MPSRLVLLTLAIAGSEAVFSYPKEARKAEIGEFPWLVAILRGSTLLKAGTLVSRFYTVTTCPRIPLFKSLKPPERLYSNVRVVAGTISKNPFEHQGSQIRWVYYWEEHRKCRAGGDTGHWSYDISVIKVRQQFIFNELVAPMPFIRDQKEMRRQVEDIISNERKCVFAGWGPHKFHKITFIDDWPPEYEPFDTPVDISEFYCGHCYPETLRVINMTVISDEECYQRCDDIEFRRSAIYRRMPPEDTLCAIGQGRNGTMWKMNRSGLPCSDSGSPLVCETPNGPLAVGHFSYRSYQCTIEYADFPSVFTRYDWAIHPWLNKFYSPTMFEKHWVDPEFPEFKEYCPDYVYGGHIPPNW